MVPDRSGDVGAIPQLLLLRHGEVGSHRGDVPLTPAGRAQAVRAGRLIAGLGALRVLLLVSPTLRARQTGLGMLRGLTSAQASIEVTGPTVEVTRPAVQVTGPTVEVTGPTVDSALRNPDLYLAGHRVDMVSSAAAFAEQVPRATEAQVTSIAFYSGFLTSSDRIGYWLNHADPPGDNAATVAARIREFAASLALDQGAAASPGRDGRADLVVGITQSPVLRALGSQFAGADPGEPDFLSGYRIRIRGDGSLAPQSVNYADAMRPVPSPGAGGTQCNR